MTDAMLCRFIEARRRYILSQFQNLNAMQQEAVAGVIINPWGEHLVLCKADIALILDMGMR